MLEALTKVGVDSRVSLQTVARLRKADFVNITEQHGNWAMRPWPKDPMHKEMGK